MAFGEYHLTSLLWRSQLFSVSLSLSLTHTESLYPWNWNMHLWTGFLINFLVTARGRADSSEIHLFVRRHLYLDCVFILSSPRLRDEATAKLVTKKIKREGLSLLISRSRARVLWMSPVRHQSKLKKKIQALKNGHHSLFEGEGGGGE